MNGSVWLPVSPVFWLLVCLPVASQAVSPKPDKLAAALADVGEVVFAVRAPGKDGHWYADFGYWDSDATEMMYGPDDFGFHFCHRPRARKASILWIGR